MPRVWYDRHAVNKIEEPEERESYRRTVADKKPYFMRYIYPALMKQYNTYKKNTDRNALREFQMTVDELYRLPIGETTERQREFLQYYEYRMPVGTNNCLMNKICRRFEEEFDEYMRKHAPAEKFDYTFMKSEAQYVRSQFYRIKSLYEDYNKRLVAYSVFARYERIDPGETCASMALINSNFRRECDQICSNGKELCDIVLDLCYRQSSTKRFAWNICGAEIIKNLLLTNDGIISYPVLDDDGDIIYGGNRFSMETLKIGEDL